MPPVQRGKTAADAPIKTRSEAHQQSCGRGFSRDAFKLNSIAAKAPPTKKRINAQPHLIRFFPPNLSLLPKQIIPDHGPA
jgi:hypothetical protein